MSRVFQDIRHALRTCVRAPLVSTLAIVAFALGIGVTTAVFSIFYSVLLKPLPYPNPEQLVRVYDTQPACPTCPASFPKYTDWKARNQVFSAIGGSMQALFVLTGLGSRGFCAAPLLAEHVAAVALGASSPLPASLARRIEPKRFETTAPLHSLRRG